MMSDLLHQLAEKLGISTSFTYGGGVIKTSVVSDDLLRFFIESLGYGAKNEAEMQRSLERLEKKRWQRAMEAIYVVTNDNPIMDIVLPQKEVEGGIEVYVAPEGQDDFHVLNVAIDEVETRQEGRILYVKEQIRVCDNLDFGYYDIKVKTSKTEYKTVLAIAPQKCFAMDTKGKSKLFGFAVQLYSVKSQRNWGVGDFSDLENIYIDVEKVPFYETSDKDENAVNAAREKETIDYTAVYNAKIKALQNIFERVQQNATSEYAKEFQAFKKADSGELNRLAVFQALCHARCIADEKNAKKIQELLSSALGSDVEKFAHKHAAEIDFFKFLQFEADRQLRLIEKKIIDRYLAFGLYRDLTVCVSKDSAEVWSD